MEAKRLYRSNSNKVFTGVCGGIGEYFNVDPVIVRIIWAVITCMSAGTGIVGYIIASVIIPEVNEAGQEKRNYGCLYAICIFILAAVLISVVSSIFGFLGYGLFSGVRMMTPFWHGSFSLGPMTFIFMLLNGIAVIAVIALVIFLITRGKKS